MKAAFYNKKKRLTKKKERHKQRKVRFHLVGHYFLVTTAQSKFTDIKTLILYSDPIPTTYWTFTISAP
jgi:hypothetical protein